MDNGMGEANLYVQMITIPADEKNIKYDYNGKQRAAQIIPLIMYLVSELGGTCFKLQNYKYLSNRFAALHAHTHAHALALIQRQFLYTFLCGVQYIF